MFKVIPKMGIVIIGLKTGLLQQFQSVYEGGAS